jgi:hypothetical protein
VLCGADARIRTGNRSITRRVHSASPGLYQQLQPRRRPHSPPDAPVVGSVSHHERTSAETWQRCCPASPVALGPPDSQSVACAGAVPVECGAWSRRRSLGRALLVTSATRRQDQPGCTLRIEEPVDHLQLGRHGPTGLPVPAVSTYLQPAAVWRSHETRPRALPSMSSESPE